MTRTHWRLQLVLLLPLLLPLLSAGGTEAACSAGEYLEDLLVPCRAFCKWRGEKEYCNDEGRCFNYGCCGSAGLSAKRCETGCTVGIEKYGADGGSLPDRRRPGEDGRATSSSPSSPCWKAVEAAVPGPFGCACTVWIYTAYTWGCDYISGSGARCLTLTQCLPGTRQTTAPTISSDRRCEPCEQGRTFQPATNQASCLSVRTCAPGSQQVVAPTLSSDRQCQPCVSGATFTSSENELQCRNVTVCSASEYEVQRPTLTSDRQCRTCVLNQTFLESSSGRCRPLIQCPAGVPETTPATLTSDRVCGNCTSGTFDAKLNCLVCPANTFQPERGALECRNHTQCNPGQGEVATPSDTSDRVCRDCVLGFNYSSSANIPCQSLTSCSPMEEEVLLPSLTADRQCRRCVLGQTYLQAASRRCMNATRCLPDAWEQPRASLTSDRGCEAAPRLCNEARQLQDPASNNTGASGNASTAAPVSPPSSCACPDDSVCQYCTLPRNLAANGTLRLLHTLPVALPPPLRPCFVPMGAESVEPSKLSPSLLEAASPLLYASCAAACTAESACAAFVLLQPAAECCLYPSYDTAVLRAASTSGASTGGGGDNNASSELYSVPGAAMYTLQQCDVCAAGYYKAGRRCLRFALPPVVVGGASTRTLHLPLSTPSGTLLLALNASAEPGYEPLRFQLEVDDPRLRVTPEGDVKLTTALSSAGSFTVFVLVEDTRSSCTTPNPRTGVPVTQRGPCQTRVPLVVRVAVFLGCPRSQEAFVPLGQTQAALNWSQPQLPPFLTGLAVEEDLGDVLDKEENSGGQDGEGSTVYRYSLGRHTVLYRTPVLDVGGRVECRFELTVRRGYGVTLSSVGRERTAQRLREFLLVELGEDNGGGRLPVMNGTLTAAGFSLGILSPDEAPITITPPDGTQSEIRIHLEWCRPGHSFSESALVAGQLNVTLISSQDDSQSGAAALPAFISDSSTGITADGHCVRLSGRSAPLQGQQLLQFSALILTLVPGAAPPLAPQQPSVQLPYQPAAVYEVTVVTTAAAGVAVPLPVDVTAATALQDVQPPVFLNCPSQPVEVLAAAGALDAVATWEPLVAVDNFVSAPRITRSHDPGDRFSVVGSPHEVVYTAADASQQAECRFTVLVAYPAVRVSRVAIANGSFPVSAQQLVARDTSRVRHALLGESLPALQHLSALDLGNITELRLQLRAPSGLPITLRTRPDAHEAQLVLQLEWLRQGSPAAEAAATASAAGRPPPPPPPAQADVGLWLELENVQLEEGPAVAQLSPEAQAQWLAANTQLRTARLAVDPAQGILGVLQAYSLPFRRGMRFDALTLVFQFPAGRAGLAGTGAPADWVLQAGNGNGLWVEYDFALHPGSATAAAVALGGFVALLDTQPPIFSRCPEGPLALPTLRGRNYSRASWPLPLAEDNRGEVRLESSHTLNSTLPLLSPGSPPLQVVYTASDAFGNAASCNFEVAVVDEEPPQLQLPQLQVQLLPAAPRSLRAVLVPSQLQPLSIRDNSGLPGTLLAPLGDVALPVGQHSVLVRARDAYGNEAVEAMSVTVVDRTPPTITCPPSLTVPAAGNGGLTGVEWGTPSIDDNDYDGGQTRVLALQLSHASGTRFAVGATRVSAVVRDPSGNNASCTFTVTVAAPEPTRSSAGGNQGAVGVGVGVGVGLLLLLVALVVLRRARRQQPQNWAEIFAAIEQFKGREAGAADGPVVPREIKRLDIMLLGELGKGAFGVVFKGMLKEDKKRPGYLVAVKSLHETCSATDKQELLEEAAITAQFESPFVVQLVGLVTVGTPVLMVVEYAEHGSLKSRLQNDDVDEGTRLLWAGDLAEGLAHVHAKGFLHRDLAARNVLVGSDLRCKISDFGLARELDENEAYYKSRGGQLPVRWTAPEALETRKFNSKTDVWSLGVTLYELWTRAALPYGSGMNNQKVWVEVAHGLRLAQPESCSDSVYALMQQCWATAQDERPTATDAASRLRALYTTARGMPPPDPSWGVGGAPGSLETKAGSLAEDSTGYLMPASRKGRKAKFTSKGNTGGSRQLTDASGYMLPSSPGGTDANGYLLPTSGASASTVRTGPASLPGFYVDSSFSEFAEEDVVETAADSAFVRSNKADMTGIMLHNPVFKAQNGATPVYDLASVASVTSVASTGVYDLASAEATSEARNLLGSSNA